jgi:hypothetical protein
MWDHDSKTLDKVGIVRNLRLTTENTKLFTKDPKDFNS